MNPAREATIVVGFTLALTAAVLGIVALFLWLLGLWGLIPIFAIVVAAMWGATYYMAAR